ncbi:MAG: hypothetical protein OHK0013_09400 [Sandaracinaceae bacterium]
MSLLPPPIKLGALVGVAVVASACATPADADVTIASPYLTPHTVDLRGVLPRHSRIDTIVLVNQAADPVEIEEVRLDTTSDDVLRLLPSEPEPVSTEPTCVRGARLRRRGRCVVTVEFAPRAQIQARGLVSVTTRGPLGSETATAEVVAETGVSCVR